MASLLAAQGLDCEFIEGVVGRTFREGQEFRYIDSMRLSAGEFGCLLSHVKCWEALIASNRDKALVCEDDIHFKMGAGELINSLFNPEFPCLIHLETFLTSIVVRKKFISSHKHYRVFEMLSKHAGAASYVINRAAATLLLSVYLEMRRPVDIELFDPQGRTIPHFLIYQVVPAPCIQDNVLNDGKSTSFLKSTITDQREAAV